MPSPASEPSTSTGTGTSTGSNVTPPTQSSLVTCQIVAASLIHLHRLADKLPELRAAIDHFLDQFADGSLDLLRYVGLPTPD